MKFTNPIKKILLTVSIFCCVSAHALANGFVYLKDIDPSIKQDMRYAGFHNMIGRPLNGYFKQTCILSSETASKLRIVQTQLRAKGLGLKVYDCYRPLSAVQDLLAWSKDKSQTMKQEFYPEVNKRDLFALEYIALRSGHSRGSTVDLTIVPLPAPIEPTYKAHQKLVSCAATRQLRFRDNSIEMGGGYDCFDEISHFNSAKVNPTAAKNRQLLRSIMLANGFEPYTKEWWHFTLKFEPYPHSYFNFPVQ